MTGRIVVIVILVAALISGAALWYLQIYGYYYEVTPNPGHDVTLVALATGQPEPVSYSGFRAIDADSSPIRYRACFAVGEEPSLLAATYTGHAGGTPLVAPGWFDCFDASEIGAGIETGLFHVFLSARNIHWGVDRVVAVAPDGRGWAWHELNDCGRKAYDGTPVAADCPPRPQGDGQ